jgi:pimeloyl-ACP methyl ester carboxylesterase
LTHVALSYDDNGSGPALMFLHGGASDRTFWDPQLAYFRRRFRLVVPDLRGHGASPAPGGEYTVPAFAGDVAALADAIGIRAATVIGHSLGGLVALALPALHPGVAARVVALDSPLLLPLEVAATFESLAGAPPHEFRQAARESSEAAVSQDADPALRVRSAAAQDATDLDAFISLTRHVFDNCYEDLLARCDVPALSIGAIIPNRLDRLRSLIPQLYLGRVVGSGHFLQLEVPDQVNAMLERFLAVTKGSDSRQRREIP